MEFGLENWQNAIMDAVTSLALFFGSFILLWIGAGIAVQAISKISHSLRMSSFFVSFFVLGLFTSITEIMVGINALLADMPAIFVGNLIGSSMVIFLLVIPLLAIFSNGIHLNHAFTFKDLVTAVLVVGFPALLTLDGRVSLIDVLICFTLYFYFVFIQEKKSQSIGKLVLVNLGRSTIYTSLGKILIAIMLVFFGSEILVNQTSSLASLLGVSPYIISILVISLGTNIPELSIALRAVLSKKKDIAFGNYVGSATLNTLELGVLGLLSNKPIQAAGSSYSMIIFIIGLLLFLYYGRSKYTISRGEGFGLLACYLLFVFFELTTGPVWNLPF
jgi:cation:H+ antiporter